ncbi:MAG: hypothetical protein CMJ18_18075, partial [Phycisphaeraceae bacterium]|nr:hypothetical protein [Phycisphaeraceae bacterium]
MDRLPPARREGPARVLFLHSCQLGMKTVALQLKAYADRAADIDAVHVDLVPALWVRALGKRLLTRRFEVPATWDLQAWRGYMIWKSIVARWLRGPLPIDRFDVVHVLSQGVAGAARRAAGSWPRWAVNVDSTGELESREFGYPRVLCRPFISAERRMFAMTDLVVCQSRWARDSVVADYGVPVERTQLARNGIDLSEAPPRE